jgi:hypothetical protein
MEYPDPSANGYPSRGTQPYGRSGSVLLLNPVSLRVQTAADNSAAELRDPRVIRTWPVALVPIPPGPVPAPVITGIVVTGPGFTVNGSGFSRQADVFVKVGTGAGSFVAAPTEWVDAGKLHVTYAVDPGQNYAVKVDDPFGGESNVMSIVA